MRKLFAAVILLFCAKNLVAQSYVPFPTDSARWRMSYGMSVAFCAGFAGEAQYEITGDTILGSQTYHKIYEISYSVSPNCFMPSGNGFVCGIREDSSKHIWIRFDASQPEELLYDFNLVVGDTVYTMQNCACDAIVTSIDSILIGSTYRKQFNISRNFNCGAGTIQIIEGIGSTGGLLECFGWLEASSNLTCFWQDGQVLYPYPTAICAPLIENVSAIEPEKTLIVSPNPATEQVVVSSPDGLATAMTMSIIDVNGQIVRSEIILPMNDVITIGRAGLPPGMYILKLSNNEDGTVRYSKLLFL